MNRVPQDSSKKTWVPERPNSRKSRAKIARFFRSSPWQSYSSYAQKSSGLRMLTSVPGPHDIAKYNNTASLVSPAVKQPLPQCRKEVLHLAAAQSCCGTGFTDHIGTIGPTQALVSPCFFGTGVIEAENGQTSIPQRIKLESMNRPV